MKAVKRHQEIIELVQAQGFVSTEELVERFDVSPQTIRRDLNELAEANKLRRNHGGATMAAQRLPPVRRTPLITRGKFLTKMKKRKSP